jgi:amino acid adenylation domain-containing protein
MWMQDYFGFTSHEVFLQTTACTFDVSLFELFGWSLAGGSVVMPAPLAERDPGALLNLVKDYGITHLHFVPSMLSAFFAYLRSSGDGGELKDLTSVICSGEAISVELVREFRTRLGDPFQIRLINLYGPTEAAVHSSYFDCADLDRQALVPIGRPVWNTQLHILDECAKPVPIGAIGELHIGGIQVADGYLNRRELTAQRFVPNPFSGKPGDRLYKTGDMARLLNDGTISFLGRNDFQIQIRGVRIEPGEIEKALTGLDGVAEAVVLGSLGRDGDTQLLAYVTGERGQSLPEAARLLELLRQRLPSHFIPAAIVVMETFPLNSSGKLDRKRLPTPDFSGILPATGQSDREEDPVREIAAAIWSDILKSGLPSAKANFFDQGGHSLLAIRLLARLEETTGRKVALPVFFDNPSFKGLCEALSSCDRAEHCRISPSSPDHRKVLPLTWGQRRMLVLNRLDTGGTGFNIVFASVHPEQLDKSRLRQALSQVLDVHEALRLHFSESGGDWQAVVGDTEDILDSVFHWTEYPDATLGSLLDPTLETVWNRRLDLDTGPLCELHVSQYSGGGHLIAFLLHHIIADETAEDILWDDLSRAYRHGGDTSSDPLPAPKIQAGDVSLWEMDPDREAHFKRDASAWAEHLEGVPTLLNLPFDLPVPVEQGFVGGRVPLQLDDALSEQIDRHLRGSALTPFMGFLAAWGAFLSRLCRQEDLVIGVPVSMRRFTGLERTIGFLLNTLPLRIQPGADKCFADCLAEVRGEFLQAYDLAGLPFDQLVSAVPHARHPGRSPLVQAMLVMSAGSSKPPVFEGVESQLIETFPSSAKFDLTLFVGKNEKGYHFDLEYRSDLFLERTVRDWLSDFVAFLGNLFAEPNKPMGSLGCIARKQHRKQVEWSTTPVQTGVNGTLVELLLDSFHKHGDSVALSDGGQRITYRQLHEAATAIAVQLGTTIKDTAPCVGVCGSRSISLIVQIIGVLVSGRGYVPLDPSWPPERLGHVIEDAPIDLLLAVSGEDQSILEDAVATLPVGSPKLKIQRFETDAGINPSIPVTGINGNPSPNDLAYIIYTSGSTGKPKGVMVEQTNLLASTLARMRYYAGQPRRFMLLSPAIFDSSVAGIFWTLASGGCLCLPQAGLERDPRRLAQWIAKQKITTFLCLPSLYEHLLDGLSGLKHRLKTIIVAGESCPEALSMLHFKRLPQVALFNEYGPTEGTVWATVASLGRKPGTQPVPIGRPIPGGQAHVVGKTLRYGPRGAVGELVIGGPGVSRGYWRDPDLTADRYLDGPVGDLPPGRFYRTGDLARWDVNGELHFLGRLDAQIKVRGFRIEPGEIESHIRKVEGVSDAVVMPSIHGAEGVRLDAWVCYPKASSEDVNEPTILKRLRAVLPAYMVPSRVHCLKGSFPLTATGKVDRPALAGMHSSSKGSSRDLRPEKLGLSRTESTLLEMWQAILGRDDFGIEEDFFDLGGHSYLAIRVFSLIEERFGKSLSVGTLYKASTVRSLAELIDHEEAGRGKGTYIIPIKSGSGSNRLFCIHPRDGGVLIYRDLGKAMDPRISVTGIEAPWFRGGKDQSSTIEETAALYMEEMLRQDYHGETYHLCGFSVGGLIALELGRLLKMTGYRVGVICLLDTYNPGQPPFRMPLAKRWRRRLFHKEVKSVPDFFRNAGLVVRRTVQAGMEGVREKASLKRIQNSDFQSEALPLEMRLLQARNRIVHACDQYRPKSIDLDLIVVHAQDMDDGYERCRDLGWGGVATAELSIVEVQGDHTTFMGKPYVADIATALGAAILREDS